MYVHLYSEQVKEMLFKNRKWDPGFKTWEILLQIKQKP